jgi:hypothetical protein
MIPAEMESVVRLLEELPLRLKGRDCDDIIEDLAFYRAQAKNDFAAKVVCRELVVMCHPQWWGDRFVTGMDRAEWIRLLKELRTAAETALDRIERRQAASRR